MDHVCVCMRTRLMLSCCGLPNECLLHRVGRRGAPCEDTAAQKQQQEQQAVTVCQVLMLQLLHPHYAGIVTR